MIKSVLFEEVLKILIIIETIHTERKKIGTKKKNKAIDDALQNVYVM